MVEDRRIEWFLLHFSILELSFSVFFKNIQVENNLSMVISAVFFSCFFDTVAPPIDHLKYFLVAISLGKVVVLSLKYL